eukprot:Rmarinus@m.28885
MSLLAPWQESAIRQHHTSTFIGRRSLLNQIDKHVFSEDPRPLMLLGHVGSGKTATLVQYIHEFEQGDVRGRKIFPSFVHLNDGSTRRSAADLCRAMMLHLQNIFNIEWEIPFDDAKVVKVLGFWLNRAAERAQTILAAEEYEIVMGQPDSDVTPQTPMMLICVDALDLLADQDTIKLNLSWFPKEFPGLFRVVCTMGAEEGALAVLEQSRCPALHVTLLDETERKMLLETYLTHYAASDFSDANRQSVLEAEDGGNPLFLRLSVMHYVSEPPSERAVWKPSFRLTTALNRMLVDVEGAVQIPRSKKRRGLTGTLVGADILTLIYCVRYGITMEELQSAVVHGMGGRQDNELQEALVAGVSAAVKKLLRFLLWEPRQDPVSNPSTSRTSGVGPAPEDCSGHPGGANGEQDSKAHPGGPDATTDAMDANSHSHSIMQTVMNASLSQAHSVDAADDMDSKSIDGADEGGSTTSTLSDFSERRMFIADHAFRKAVEARYMATHDAAQVAFLRVADFFEQLDAKDPRRYEELPFSLLEGRAVMRLHDVLGDLRALDHFYRPVLKYEIFRLWMKLGGNRFGKAANVYRQKLSRPKENMSPAEKTRAYKQVAAFLQEVGELSAVQPILKKLLELQEAKYGPQTLMVAQCMQTLALNMLHGAINVAQAVEIAQRVVLIREASPECDPVDCAYARQILGMLLFMNGRFDEGSRELEAAHVSFGMSERVLQHELPPPCLTLAEYYTFQGDPDRVNHWLQQGLDWVVRVGASKHRHAASVFTAVAKFHTSAGRFSTAKAMLQHALEIAIPACGETSKEVGTVYLGCGTWYAAQGMYREADAAVRRALTLRETLLGRNHLMVVEPLELLAKVHASSCGRGDSFLRRALRIQEDTLGQDHPLLLNLLTVLGDLQCEQGALQPALRTFERCRQIAMAAYGPSHQSLIPILDVIASVQWRRRKKAETLTALKDLLPLREDYQGASSPMVALTLTRLATALVADLNDTLDKAPKGAVDAFHRASRILDQFHFTGHNLKSPTGADPSISGETGFPGGDPDGVGYRTGGTTTDFDLEDEQVEGRTVGSILRETRANLAYLESKLYKALAPPPPPKIPLGPPSMLARAESSPFG